MIKRLLIGGSLAFVLAPLSSAMAADLTFTVTNEQTSGSTYAADLLVQHASGTTELVPFMITATGQYTMTVSTLGTFYTPPGQASFRVWGGGSWQWAYTTTTRGGAPRRPVK